MLGRAVKSKKESILPFDFLFDFAAAGIKEQY